MRVRTKVAFAILAVASLLAISTNATAATEDNGASDPNAAKAATAFPVDAKPVADHLMIDGERIEVAVMPDFPNEGYVELLTDNGVEYGEIVEKGVVVTERTAAKGITAAAAASCGTWINWAAPGNGNYIQGPPGCSFIGLNKDTKAGYEFVVNVLSLGGACTQALGYHLTPVSTGGYQYTAYWTGMGCRSAGSTWGGTVQWGNVAAVKKILVKSTGAGIGSNGQFR